MVARNEVIPKELERELAQFTGSEEYTRIRYPWLRKSFLLTDGVKFLADRAKAYWLIDIIASHQTNKRVSTESFQVWHLFVRHDASVQSGFPPDPSISVGTVLDFQSPVQIDPNRPESNNKSIQSFISEWKLKAQPGNALITCEDGNGNLLAIQNIPYSDFPLSEIRLYFSSDDFSGIVVMLPSEY